MKRVALAVIVALIAPEVVAAPPQPAKRTRPRDPNKLGAAARVAFGRELRPARETVGRSTGPLTAEEATAAQIQKLMRGPLLRGGVTGLFVADANTGEPVFAVNAEDPLNPASNVKMISTATAIELLGPGFRFPTRVLGPKPIAGVVTGDVYLFGSYDPTLTVRDFDDIARDIAARGIIQIRGDVILGSDPTRDGIYRPIVPIAIAAGQPGHPPTASVPPGFDLVEIKITATTARIAMRPRLTYKAEASTTPAGQPHVVLTIGGAIGKDGKVDYPMVTKYRGAAAAYALIAALRARQIALTGTPKSGELGPFVGGTVSGGELPIELGRHDSQTVGEIIAKINKWSINWLADRLVMTAAALSRNKPPTMELAVDAMYAWLDRNPRLKRGIVLDTGSGLSYRTQISPRELVSVVRSAGGFSRPADATSTAWLRSLSIVGTDGTLQHRFLGSDLGGRIIGKTGSLSTVIALSGVLDIDPQRPLVFALVTNTDAPLSKPVVRKAHELVIAEICKYAARTLTKPPARSPSAPPPAATQPEETEDTGE